MGKFVVTKSTNGSFHFNLKAGNGEIVLTSEAYNSKSACENGMESVRKNALEDANYVRKESTVGKPYFNLKAANHQVIGTSEMYSSAASRDKGIESVKHNAAEASIDDQTA
ncbi:MAG: hypothetical protein ACI9CZ_001829 [Flavobacterium sp.]|jgi:uncharacterized protein YegP (UPF0339 family)